MRAGRLVLALAGVALLAGCATPLPVAEPDAVPAVAQPGLADTQLERVLGDVAGTLAEADAAALAAATAPDPVAARQEAVAALAPRVVGPAAEMRAAQYAIASQAGEAALTQLPAGVQTVVDPASETWPRVLMVVTEVPDDLQAPLLLTLVQQSPRDPYALWSWQRLFGGVQMPATMQPQVGSEVVPADEPGSALLSPKDVLAQYLDVVTIGDASAFSATFTADPVRTRIAQQREAWRAAVGQGSVTETYAPVPGGPWAMGTADGGSIVTGAFQTATTLTLVDSTLTVNDATSVLLGASTIKQSLTLTWDCTVAFAVPPAGSTDPVTVLGAEYVLVAATGS